VFVTKSYPLQLFISLQDRLTGQYREGSKRLAELLKGVEVTVDTFKSLEPTLGRRREEALIAVGELESRYFLSAILKAAIRRAENAAGVPELRDRIAYFEATAALWAEHLAGQPSRDIPQDELLTITSQINELRAAGSSEAAVSQRNSLRAHKVIMPIIAREDVVDRRAQADRLQMTLELERANLQQILAQTPISIQVLDYMGPLLMSLGVDGVYAHEDGQPVPAESSGKAIDEPATE